MKSEPDTVPGKKDTMLPKNPATPAPGPIELPPGIPQPHFDQYSDRAKEWARFGRSLEIDTSRKDALAARKKRTDKVTPDLLAQIAGYHENNFFFAIWLAQEGDEKCKGVQAYEDIMSSGRSA